MARDDLRTTPYFDEGTGKWHGPFGEAPFVPSDNWCQVSFNNAAAPTLNVSNPIYTVTAADLAIDSQSGTDFSVGEENSSGAILSAAGGWFQACAYVSPPGGVTLDGGSTAQRWMEWAYITGEFGDAFPSTGSDAFVPVNAAPNGDLAITVPSMPGHASPGRAAAFHFQLEFVYATGTDAITDPFTNFGRFIIWQVG